ncbi:hypothetical protein GKZ68_07150 [Hymenobacter sp. BRD128]|uniref:hypothetical protein n=1 Tax=Hymenobacter sp. BRD128 TaxID=2675878 RepID=UPI001566CC4B|nr:hypothetical protein [Hymenobacter sp. BRD128]QKG56427.1 hypothetical protein GKZ68_07150 [Hymenobacter sp. BRD128]
MEAPPRFLLLLALGSLALAAGYAALVLGTASWAEARALDAIYPYEGWHLPAFSPAAWRQTQAGLTAVAAVLALAGLGLGPGTRAGRAELAATLAEVRRLGAGAGQRWQHLSRWHRRVLLGHLAVLTAARLYLSLTIPWADDGGSFEYFVRHGLLAVSAYYPIPNNHVLANTIAWAFYQVHPGFWWAMRLPVLLASTAGTGLMFGMLVRRLGYWPALLAAGAMGWTQLSLYHAAAGRGYWLVALLAAVVFWALLVLLEEPAGAGVVGSRLAWLSLVGASILGCYAVPTFAYVVTSAFSWLGVQALLRRDWRGLAQLVAMGLVAVLGAAALYTPLLLVSGSTALVANPYVQALPARSFWAQLPAHAWFLEGWLAGQRQMGGWVIVLGLGLFGWLALAGRRGRLVPAYARQVRQVGWPALWFVLWPYVLMMGQRVLPPERTLLYKAWFLFILLALVLLAWPGRWPGWRWLPGLLLVPYGSYEVASQVLNSRRLRQANADYAATYGWLAQRTPRQPVLLANRFLWLWLRFEAHTQAPTQPWLADRHPRPGVRYAYILVRGDSLAPAGAGAVVRRLGQITIYRYAGPAGASPRGPLLPGSAASAR